MRVALICALFAVRTLAEADSSCSISNDTVNDPSVLLQVSVSNDLSGLPSFLVFIEDFGRSYDKGSKEYEMRHTIYVQNLKNIHRQNRNPKRRWDAGVNHLSDRTKEELSQLRGLRAIKAGESKSVGSGGPSLEQISNVSLPEEKDWTHLEAVKASSDQSSCGSCWAVATATTLSANAQAKGHSLTFSPQELVSCVPNPHHCGGDGGCEGSTVELALNWVMEQGLATEDETPYHASNTKCKKDRTAFLSGISVGHLNGDIDDHERLEDMIAVGLHGAKTSSSAGLALGLRRWERLPENEYLPLMRAVAETGPVAVSVGASDWHSFAGGIFDGCKKDSVIDHAVTLVGYGKDTKSGDKWWLIKNSWGNGWGENGNIKLLREEGNVHCGTDHQPKVGTACEDAPDSVHVCGMCGILYDAVVPHFDEKK